MHPASQLFLNTKLAKHFDGQHPWVLARSVIEPTSEIPPGDVVELLHPNGSWIGRGVYNPASRIRVRLYQWERSKSLDAGWICGQLARAVEMRELWMKSHQQLDALRLVNSEGDGLSGLVVDKFGDYLVVQVTARSMLGWFDVIKQWLVERFQPAGLCLRIDATTASNEGIEVRDEWLHGECPSDGMTISENGTLLRLDLAGGQKTGCYLDQRANRIHAAKWVSEGPMLDVCCYQGGFSLAALRWGQPSSVLAVDSSKKALEHAQRNAVANDLNTIEFVQGDCFDTLEQFVSEGRQYQTIVLDPPRMASNRKQVTAALRAYHRLNLSAVRLLVPGGILVTCSCSGRVKKDDFQGVVGSVAKRSRRRIQVLESLGADFDHPIDVNCPESDYLKCLICRVH